MDAKPLRWKNKRKKSLYVSGKLIYRRLHTLEKRQKRGDNVF